jgi:hypothetical protein
MNSIKLEYDLNKNNSKSSVNNKFEFIDLLLDME